MITNRDGTDACYKRGQARLARESSVPNDYPDTNSASKRAVSIWLLALRIDRFIKMWTPRSPFQDQIFSN